MTEVMTPKGWIVKIDHAPEGFHNSLYFGGQIVGGWTVNGRCGNETLAEALSGADKVIGAFVEEIASQRARGLGTPTAKQGVLL